MSTQPTSPKQLFHVWMESDDAFFRRIDECGGWPVGPGFVTMRHCCERERPCYFSNVDSRDEWNTTIHSADEYYWWKISVGGKLKIQEKIVESFKREAARLTPGAMPPRPLA